VRSACGQSHLRLTVTLEDMRDSGEQFIFAANLLGKSVRARVLSTETLFGGPWHGHLAPSPIKRIRAAPHWRGLSLIS
jgi:hypothetical protein